MRLFLFIYISKIYYSLSSPSKSTPEFIEFKYFEKKENNGKLYILPIHSPLIYPPSSL